MEWVEITATTIDDAKAIALDRLGVDDADAEFEVIEEPKAGLFGRTRGEARVRARIKPNSVRAKADRRDRRGKPAGERSQSSRQDAGERTEPAERGPRSDRGSRGPSRPRNDRNGRGERAPRTDRAPRAERAPREDLPPVDPTTVSAVATTFLEGLVKSAGLSGSVSAKVEGEHIDIDVLGEDLGFLVGTKGATLLALQDLTRVVSQRRLGDHETRLRVDVAGYREKRREALTRFALKVAGDVKSSGQARALEPMNSSDRKIVHDALTELEGISTRSEGSDPFRRVVVALASISEDSAIDDTDSSDNE
ncbi:MAG: Jag N-terminal domain-containing protein [Ilumatobacteraceae bacterium]|jgi:spoIIIJ-associated protein|nr:Jag N-terminal domain-containing protein [Ilumatobacteraceae bacterium]MDP4695980.1 Jag N-terminal domain-containing protein [Ilumatobacteraceae bacterium]MDP4981803.1 Jag N-terminal domain-containing protein [Ilumatobacteraceae bacterium]